MCSTPSYLPRVSRLFVHRLGRFKKPIDLGRTKSHLEENMAIVDGENFDKEWREPDFINFLTS
jgi:hypothetical protein